MDRLAWLSDTLQSDARTFALRLSSDRSLAEQLAERAVSEAFAEGRKIDRDGNLTWLKWFAYRFMLEQSAEISA
jgi:hypothetical protein